MINLSIIVPCLNESENVGKIISALLRVLRKTNITYEIIIIDDQSDDDTFAIAKKISKTKTIKVLQKDLDRRGYGAVIKYGLAHAIGEYVIFVSADLVDPINLIPKMYKKLLNGFDLIQCSRYTNKFDSSTIPFSYKFYQFFFRRFVSISLGKKIPDSTYAFKMFNRKKIMSLGISSNRFNISPEIMFKALLANYRIGFIAGSQGVRLHGKSKFSFTKEGLGFLNCLFRAFLHRKKLIYWF
jgi:dolichol-phosphate mannosyltransferase